MEIQKIVIIYFVIINVVTFFMYGIDKWEAKQKVKNDYPHPSVPIPLGFDPYI